MVASADGGVGLGRTGGVVVSVAGGIGPGDGGMPDAEGDTVPLGLADAVTASQTTA